MLMTSPCRIARLAATEAIALRAMLDLFAMAFDDPEHYRHAQPDDAYLGQLLAREDFVAIAAWIDDALVGGVTAYVLPKYEQVRSELYLYDLAVAETCRRRGIATELIAALHDVARALGADTVYVQADVDDAPALALYSKLGEGREVRHFDLAPRRHD
jgi:ribosomal protein S18 acetylase RimI-like enzyme